MSLKKRIYWVAALVAVVALAAAAVTATSQFTFAGGSDDDQPITGPALQKASEAALDHTGGGRVTGTEVGDEESYYEVEVTLEDGRQVDVQLDESFNVVSDKVDDDRSADTDTDSDD